MVGWGSKLSVNYNAVQTILKRLQLIPSFGNYLLSPIPGQGTVLASGWSCAFCEPPLLLKEEAANTWGQVAAST